MAHTLIVSFNGVEVSSHPLSAGGLVIGRSKQCDIVIMLLGLARRHAQVEVDDDDDVWVSDLGTQNGTWVNNTRTEGRHRLRDGDLINCFDYTVRLVSTSTAAPKKAPSPSPATAAVAAEVRGAVFQSIASALTGAPQPTTYERARGAAEKTLGALARKLVGVDTSAWPAEIAAEVVFGVDVDALLRDPQVRAVEVAGVVVTADRGAGWVEVATCASPATVDRVCRWLFRVGPGEDLGPVVVGAHTVTVRGAAPTRRITARRAGFVDISVADDVEVVPPGPQR